MLVRCYDICYFNAVWFYAWKRNDRRIVCSARRMQEEYRDKERKLYMCFVKIEKAFDKVPRKVMKWAMRKKGLSELILRAAMSLYHGAKTKIRVEFQLTEEFLVQVGVHQRSVLSPLLFAIAVNVIKENAKKDK